MRSGFLAQERQHFFNERIRGDAVFLSQRGDVAVFDEFIRPANADHRCVDVMRIEMLHHGAAETVMQNVIFNRADHLHATSEELDRASVERLDPTRVDEGNGDTVRFKFFVVLLCDFEHGA